MAISTKIKKTKTQPNGEKQHNNGGVLVTEAVINLICERMAAGKPLYRVCEMPDMPSRIAVGNACKVNPEWGERIESMRPYLAEAKEADALDLADATVRGEVEAAAAKVKIDVIKWSAARLDPKRYGDKVSQEVSGVDGAPLINRIEIIAADNGDSAN